MDIDEIREQIAIEISSNSQSDWGEALTDTNPGHYGANYWEVELKSEDVWVDIPKKTFTYKNALFSFDVRLGGSSEESGADMSFSKIAKGEGEFSFVEGGIKIEDLEIKVDLDLFGDD